MFLLKTPSMYVVAPMPGPGSVYAHPGGHKGGRGWCTLGGTNQRLLCRKTEEGVGQKEDPAQTGREKQGLRDKVQETPGPREEEKGAEAKGTLHMWPGHFSVQLGQGVLETASLCCLGVS